MFKYAAVVQEIEADVRTVRVYQIEEEDTRTWRYLAGSLVYPTARGMHTTESVIDALDQDSGKDGPVRCLAVMSRDERHTYHRTVPVENVNMAPYTIWKDVSARHLGVLKDTIEKALQGQLN